jgi:hypothetical protein
VPMPALKVVQDRCGRGQVGGERGVFVVGRHCATGGDCR